MNIPSYVSGTIYVTAYRTLRGRIAACLQRYDLTPTTWSLLGIVMQARDGVRLNEAARILSVKAPLVTMLANDLIDRGVISRIPHHIDRRAKLLVMTPKGKAFVKTVERDMDTELKYLLKGVTETDLKAYKKVLDTIILNGQ
ncbi:MAG: MarR family transcriptional regulator [Candidatus Saccharimonadales bacterium]